MSYETSRIVNTSEIEIIIDELKCKICDLILESPIVCKDC